tara:strand:+ start:1559 stop:4855 length:3297 start_codon:yes stop_codon:yes gene_type:complete
MFVFSMTSSYGEKLNYEFGIYEGEVENGEAHGYGIFIYTRGKDKGDKYVGQFRNGQRHGYGSYVFTDGSKYVGEVMNDQFHGYGTFSHGDGEFKGEIYVGEFKASQFDGQGTYTYADGSSTSGEFKNDEPVRGVYIDRGEFKGDKYVGEMKDWGFHGQGSYTYADGSLLVGKFRDGQPLKGTFTVGAGEQAGGKYTGEFKEWNYHGFGTYTKENGEKYIGEFKDHKPFNCEVYHQDGVFWGSFIDGEWCDACVLDEKEAGLVSADSFDTGPAQLAFDQENYEKALELLAPYADKADGDTQLLFAKTYLGLEQWEDAIDWARRAQAQGNIPAAVILGGSYEFGQGVKVDYEEAVKWYRIAAESGDAYAQYSLSSMYWYGNGVKEDDSQAFKWAEKSASQGDLNGQYALGRHYLYGAGTEKDYNKAFKWFSKSALQGDIDAESEIGWLYFWGRGVEQNYKEARSHWQKAADKGSAFDMDNIASLYFNGLGVEKNAATADHWLIRAAQKADEDDRLGQLMISSLERQTEESSNEDVGFKGILGAYSAYALGVYYREGYVVQKDLAEASEWFKNAIRMGSGQAMEAYVSLQFPGGIKEFEYYGGRYTGEAVNDKPHGIGLWVSPDDSPDQKQRYYGDWIDGAQQGYGTYLYPSGGKHVGEYKDGYANGYGVWTGSEGKYVGEFKDDKMHGQGTYTWDDGTKYVGEYKDGDANGHGVWTHPDGTKYVGEFKDGNMHGQGTYTWASGNVWVGQLKNDEMHGQGTHTWFNDDEQFVGEAKEGDPWNGVQYSASGEVSGTWTDGKWCDGCKPNSTQETATSGSIELSIGSNPNSARVYVNDVYRGKTTLDINLEPGIYQVKVEKAGYELFEQRIELKKDMNLWASLRLIVRAESSRASLRLNGTGTGFVVNENYVVTADHVLEDCDEVTIRHGHREIDSKTVARDSVNDLGLMRLSQPIRNIAKLRGGKPIRKGDRVSNYGYPLYGELAESASITQGNINNLSGLGNDSRHIQLDAPSQPGNSGGPVLDSSGNVVGVISHILSKRYADKSGHIAQNVNFAVKSYLVEGFLSSNNVLFEKAESLEHLELPDIAEKAEKFTVLVECWE